MGGSVMWIVLGSLVGVVIIFLIVTTILDRKKSKKTKLEADKLLVQKRESSWKIAEKVNLVAAKNRKLLDEFVPSIGKYKMSEVKDIARKSLQEFMHTKDFKIAKSLEENEEMIEKYKLLLKTSSTQWDKKYSDVIQQFVKWQKEKKEKAIKTKTDIENRIKKTGKGKKNKDNSKKTSKNDSDKDINNKKNKTTTTDRKILKDRKTRNSK